MTPAGLLRPLASLNHADRMRRLVELGRQARTDPRLAAALARLEEGGFHDRLLSLQACHGSRDAQRLARGLADPSRLLRCFSARQLVQIADDATVVRGLAQLARKQLKRALARLRSLGRQGPVDAYLDELARRGARDLEVLLPYGSDEAVARHLALAAERGGQVFLSRLARHHPRRAVAIVDRYLESARRGDVVLPRLAQAVLPSLAKYHPDEALGLARRLARLLPAGSLHLNLIALRRPGETAQLALDLRGRGLPAGMFNAHAHRLGADLVRELARRRLVNLAPGPGWRSTHPYRWLERLPPPLRGEVFVLARGKRPAGVVDVGLLNVLPADLRRAQARRCLALARLATRPAQRLPYAAFLDWDEARELVEPWLRHPEAGLRGLALTALAGVLRFQRDRVADFLALVRARKNEQDPVRAVMLQSLARVPAIVWHEQHLDDLGGAIREALDARDLSEATAGAANALVLRLLRRFPDWAAGWLTTLVRERGRLNWGSLEQMLADDDVRRVGPVLLPVLKVWRKNERDAALLQLAGSLGRRLPVYEPILDLVENLTRTTRIQALAQGGLALIARHARSRLAGLVPRLLRDDPSWIINPAVWQHLHRRRQDLLTPFLGQKPVRGKFATGATRLVLPFQDGFHRWNAAQLETFAATLHREIADADPVRETYRITQALRQLAAMPGIDHAELIRRAGDSGEERPVIRDTALTLLGQLDTGAGVPALLEALGDDRGRVAIYALRKALLHMPAAHVLGLLRQMPRNKVTVAKEVVRLAGEMEGDEAFAFLEEVEASKPHRDVRVALLRAVWTHLDQERAWQMIDRAVQAGDPGLMFAVVRIPTDRLSSAAKVRLVGLLARLLQHPDPEVRLEVLRRCAEQPPGDPERTLLPPVVAAVGSPLPDLRRMAAQSAVVLAGPDDAALLAETARHLMPRRAAIAALVAALTEGVRADPRRHTPAARAVIDILAGDPLAANLRLGLAAATLGARPLADLLGALDAAGWRADVLMTAAQLIQSAAADLQGRGLRQLETALEGSASGPLRRLALAALLGQTAWSGWDASRVERLERYRRDPDPLVAAAAQFTFPPDEDSEEEGFDEALS